MHLSHNLGQINDLVGSNLIGNAKLEMKRLLMTKNLKSVKQLPPEIFKFVPKILRPTKQTTSKQVVEDEIETGLKKIDLKTDSRANRSAIDEERLKLLQKAFADERMDEVWLPNSEF